MSLRSKLKTTQECVNGALENRENPEAALRWIRNAHASLAEAELLAVKGAHPDREYSDGGEPGGTCPCGRTPDPGIKPTGGCWCTEDDPQPERCGGSGEGR